MIMDFLHLHYVRSFFILNYFINFLGGEIFMFDLVQHRKPGKLEAFIMIVIVFLMLGYPMIGIPNMVPHIPVLITIIFLLLYGTINKVKFSLLQESMIQSVSTSMGAVFLFFFIGILVSILMMSGQSLH